MLSMLLVCSIAGAQDAHNSGAYEHIESTAVAGNLAEAKKIATHAFKSHTSGKVKRFSRKLFNETNTEWRFVFEKLGRGPRPSSEIIIVVNKKSGEVEVFPEI